ncbi:hypothetical protein BT67DRAFT_193923 [Trichocladium antarcticum]|uniref:Uncharacterized protein n=1 Tax=Trichocladium antarcticum TaxID=1450529 RepID=A0AAN6ZFX0_9PEZI|nr:hypothetical protein BT67DRAFT_193923 [Trichocladium antarcticum]
MCMVGFLIIKTKTVGHGTGQEPTAFWRCVDVGSWGWMGGSPGPSEPNPTRASHDPGTGFEPITKCPNRQGPASVSSPPHNISLRSPRQHYPEVGASALDAELQAPPFKVIMGPSSPSWRCDLLHGIGAAHRLQSHVSARHDRTSSRLFPPYSIILDTQSAMGRESAAMICGTFLYIHGVHGVQRIRHGSIPCTYMLEASPYPKHINQHLRGWVLGV